MGTVVKFKKFNYLENLDKFIKDMEQRLEHYKQKGQCPCEVDYQEIDCKISEFEEILIQYRLMPEDCATQYSFLRCRITTSPFGWEVLKKLQQYREKLDKLYYDYWAINKYDTHMKEMFDHSDELLRSTMQKLEWIEL